jgi:hypothetical protein
MGAGGRPRLGARSANLASDVHIYQRIADPVSNLFGLRSHLKCLQTNGATHFQAVSKRYEGHERQTGVGTNYKSVRKRTPTGNSANKAGAGSMFKPCTIYCVVKRVERRFQSVAGGLMRRPVYKRRQYKKIQSKGGGIVGNTMSGTQTTAKVVHEMLPGRK